MKKAFFLKSYVLAFVLMAFIFASCNNAPSSNADAPKTDTTKTDTSKTTDGSTKPQPFSKITVNNDLFILYLDSADIRNLPNIRGIVLSYTFDANNNLTLYGWQKKVRNKDPFDNTPTIKLKTTTVSMGIWTSGTYFGNLIFHGKGVKHYQDLLNAAATGKKYILFTPQLDAYNHITYAISLSDQLPSQKGIVAQDASAESSGRFSDEENFLNPSPPKQYEY